MKILLTGSQGQVGYEIRRTLAPLGEVVAFDHSMLDLADQASIARSVRAVRPDMIINAAAYTKVDEAETDLGRAMAVNGEAPGILAQEAKRIGASIVHYSTDYVFDGEKIGPYVEEDTPNPINAYGRTKLAGEQAVMNSGASYLIFRTSWVYGTRGRNFMRTVAHCLLQQPALRVVDDQIGAPTWSRLIAEATALAIARHRASSGLLTGLYHLSCGGSTSWFGFAQAIADKFATTSRCAVPEIQAIDTASYPTLARRPKNSLLESARAKERLGVALPAWQEGMGLCLEDISDWRHLLEGNSSHTR